MKAPYRNSLRSKRMLRQAFIELMREKPIDKITVAELTERADLSRKTFYAHYQDIYAMLEEYERETMNELTEALEESKQRHELSNPQVFLQAVAAKVEENKELYQVLMSAKGSDAFIQNLKLTIVNATIAGLNTEGIKDEQGYVMMLEILSAGFISLFRTYLSGGSDLTPEAIVNQTNQLYIAGVKLYR